MKRFAAVVLVTVAGLGACLGGPAQARGVGIHFGDEVTDFYPERISCLNDYQIREAVADLGYSDISLNVPDDKHIQVRATLDGWVYLLDFNYCSAQVERRAKLRPAQ